ncbi:biotin/lipoyl-binding protein, partial [Novosphingobium sp. 1949]
MNAPSTFDTAASAPSPAGHEESALSYAPARRFKPRTYVIGAAIAMALAGLGWKALHSDKAAAVAMPVPSVQTATPLVREVTQWDDYVGRFAPSKTVEVRPRVSGAITAIHFKDGDTVRQGQVLFTVDARPYRAALSEAEADVASAKSALALARSDYDRVAGLTGDEAMAASEVDQLRTRVRSASAALA